MHIALLTLSSQSTEAFDIFSPLAATMFSLWGSKKDGDAEETSAPPRTGESSGHDEAHPSEANERTRLLPPQSQGQAYLSPDDPAVSQHLWKAYALSQTSTNAFHGCPRTTFGAYDSCGTSPYSSPS